jgi:hypothetical protein
MNMKRVDEKSNNLHTLNTIEQHTAFQIQSNSNHIVSQKQYGHTNIYTNIYTKYTPTTYKPEVE